MGILLVRGSDGGDGEWGSRVHVQMLVNFVHRTNKYFRITSDVCVFTFQPTQIGGCLSQLIYCKTNIEQNEH